MRKTKELRTEKTPGKNGMQLCDILPVLRQINALHSTGRCGFDICAQNIAKIGFRGTFKLLPKAFYKTRLRPGYSAPEQYSGSLKDRRSDVYKASALVFFLMTGELPKAAFERRQGEPAFITPVPKRFSAVADEVEKGLAPDISQRAASLDALCEAIQSLSPDCTKTAPVRNSKRLALLIVTVAALFFGTLAVSEINYAQAEKYAEEGAFDKAERSLDGVPAFYKDAKQLRLYINAGILGDEGSFDEAERLFAAMGDYRGAALMVDKTRYSRALHQLEEGYFQQAQTQFEALGGYRDARNMAKEAAYKRAAALKKNGELLSARCLLAAICPYKDCETLISSLNTGIYEKAFEYYNNSDYSKAAEYFSAVPGHMQADSFGILCSVLSPGTELEQSGFEQLMLCADEIDMSLIFMREDIIGMFLKGEWKDKKGNTLITAEDQSVTTNLPWEKGRYCYFGDAAVYIKTRGSSDVKAFEFEYIDKDTISVYCCKNGRTYTLSRQI